MRYRTARVIRLALVSIGSCPVWDALAAGDGHALTMADVRVGQSWGVR